MDDTESPISAQQLGNAWNCTDMFRFGKAVSFSNMT